MSDYLPDEVLAGLDRARKAAQRASPRLRVRVGDRQFSILRLWDEGFALAEDAAPPLRGYVDIYDGGRHLSQCLVVAAGDAEGERLYEFKRTTSATDRAPRDYAAEDTGPVALIPHL